MERNTQRHGLVNLLALLVAGVCCLVLAQSTGVYAALLISVFMGVGALIAAVSWFQMRLEEREKLEQLEFDELSRSKSGTALFATTDSEVFPARRSREQFERFFVPGFAAFLFLAEMAAAFFFLRTLRHVVPLPIQNPLMCLGMLGMFFLLLFLIGRFSTSLARLEGLRLLRPSATYLLLSAYLCFAALAGVAGNMLGLVKQLDLYVAKSLAALLLLIALETLVNLILELYRPRVKGKIERPIYESRLVSLLGQPEGLITTAAQTLDYQFGFKVSETWVYRLFARWLPWLVLGQAGALLLSTTLVFIEPGQQAMLERFGRFVSVLGPGLHFKLPWPMDRAFRYPAERIQTVEVGFVPTGDDAFSRNTVLWTSVHPRQENFMVAKRDTADADTNADRTARPLPVNLLTVGIPVQYQITNLYDWVYQNQNPEQILEDLAYREVSRFFVSADINEVMSRTRGASAAMLQQRIQAAAIGAKLGVGIVFVGLEDIHPPSTVAPDYEKVVSILQTTNANIRMEVAAGIMSNALARMLAERTVSEALSDQQRRETNAVAQAELFTKQIPAYRASPSVFMARAYLDTLVQAVADARTYVLLTTNTHNIAIIDMAPKIRSGLLDQASLGAPPSPGRTN